jgi:serine/alanine adding enzyme
MVNSGDSNKADVCDVEVSNQMPAWEEFLARHPERTIYHNPRWGRLMLQAYSNRAFYLTARSRGQITGVLQLVKQQSIIFGTHLCSLPYFDAAGILADDVHSAEALVDHADRIREAERAQWVEIRHITPVAGSIPSRTDKVTLHLKLPNDEDQLWDEFKPKVRNKIRKAQKSEVKVESGGKEFLEQFYSVYTRTMRDLGSPPHSRSFFRLILEAFPQETTIFVARIGGKVAAASLTLTDTNGMRVPWSGSDWRLRRLNINMVLYWSMLSYACRNRAKCFDFGRSTVGSGTYAFKKQWGACEIPLAWQFVTRPGAPLPALRPDSGKYRLMVACWKKLPVWTAELLGPKVIAKLS